MSVASLNKECKRPPVSVMLSLDIMCAVLCPFPLLCWCPFLRDLASSDTGAPTQIRTPHAR